MTYQALLEQVELLKTIKADREDLEEALAEKADAQAIHRKVFLNFHNFRNNRTNIKIIRAIRER